MTETPDTDGQPENPVSEFDPSAPIHVQWMQILDIKKGERVTILPRVSLSGGGFEGELIGLVVNESTPLIVQIRDKAGDPVVNIPWDNVGLISRPKNPLNLDGKKADEPVSGTIVNR